MQIVFVDPPDKHPNPRPHGTPQNHPWKEIAEQLRARPGRWALCLRDIAVQPGQITHAKISWFRPAGAYEARTVVTHNRDDRGRQLVDLYIKYVGDPADSPPRKDHQ